MKKRKKGAKYYRTNLDYAKSMAKCKKNYVEHGGKSIIVDYDSWDESGFDHRGPRGSFILGIRDHKNCEIHIFVTGSMNIFFDEEKDNLKEILKIINPFIVVTGEGPWRVKSEISVDVVEFQKKKHHADALKENVIRPWIRRLNRAVTDILPQEKDMVSISPINGPSGSTVIDETLLQDLRMHVDPEVYSLQEELDKMNVKIKEQRNELMDLIESRVLETFEELNLELSDKWGKNGCVHRRLPWFIFKIAVSNVANPGHFREEDLHFFDDAVVKNSEYWAQNAGYVKLVDTQIDDAHLKKIVDGKMKELLQDVADGAYTEKIRAIMGTHQSAVRNRDRLREALNEHLHKVTFEGYCNYL